MAEAPPKVSVVVATHNRAGRLAALIDSLRAQTLAPEDFEVIVVDDASSDRTPEVLEAAERSRAVRLRHIRRDVAGGPALARNEGWRAARAPLVAFTDDDCVVSPRWLEAGLEASATERVVQGRTDPHPAEVHRLSPFARTVEIHQAGPMYETCNIFYPRAVLERLDGFDGRGFPVCGEDADLAWRAKELGAAIDFEPEAQVFHEVKVEGPLAMLRHVRRWEGGIPLYVRHPDLRAKLHRGLFWSPTHEYLLRFLVAVPLLRRMPTLAALLAAPYVTRLVARRSRGLFAPYLLLIDLVEVYAVIRGALKNRVLVI
jgi:glycosyltransferase involved in cell wall biosynthesis